MARTGVRLGVVTLASAALLGVGGASAWASSPPTNPPSLATIQQKAAAAISQRVGDLNAAISKVNGTKRVGSGATTLVAYLQIDIAPLQTLGQKIAADSTVSMAESDAATIFTNYRVLALVRPAAHLAATSYAIDLTAIPRLSALSAWARSRMNSSNQAALQPLIDDLTTIISATTDGTSGVAATVLGYTPMEWNANRDLLASARGSVRAANSDIAKARQDVQQIRSILTPAGSTPATTTT